MLSARLSLIGVDFGVRALFSVFESKVTAEPAGFSCRIAVDSAGRATCKSTVMFIYNGFPYCLLACVGRVYVVGVL
ncbi:MAG: hypothetical protein P3X22_007570 [Thermoprotei archaeon]|nr:hypothetical protein [Thermoprotei archaeon]